MNESEYLALVDPLKHKLFRFAKRFLVSVEEAEDATQDVLLKLWKYRDKLSNYKNPEAFAMTITRNHCLDRLKSKQASILKITHNNYKRISNTWRSLRATTHVRDDAHTHVQVIAACRNI